MVRHYRRALAAVGAAVTVGAVAASGIAISAAAVNREGRCAACALRWPCRQAELAEFALGAF